MVPSSQMESLEKANEANALGFGRQRKGGQFRNCYFSPIQCALVASKRKLAESYD